MGEAGGGLKLLPSFVCIRACYTKHGQVRGPRALNFCFLLPVRLAEVL